MNHTKIHPNVDGNWTTMRNTSFEKYVPLVPERKFHIVYPD
jgi:predicted helicase